MRLSQHVRSSQQAIRSSPEQPASQDQELTAPKLQPTASSDKDDGKKRKSVAKAAEATASKKKPRTRKATTTESTERVDESDERSAPEPKKQRGRAKPPTDAEKKQPRRRKQPDITTPTRSNAVHLCSSQIEEIAHEAFDCYNRQLVLMERSGVRRTNPTRTRRRENSQTWRWLERRTEVGQRRRSGFPVCGHARIE